MKLIHDEPLEGLENPERPGVAYT
jgi:hypothetical protein